ncbi:MAG: DNA-binding protein WhiA [Bacilli bacterium]|nr:DNA-binding protein WhiA [Bacilli bacterium]
MSFTATIKNELSKLDMTKSENIAELSAFIRNNAKYVEDFIELSTENEDVSNRINKLFKDIYDVDANIVIKKNNTFNRNNIYVIKIQDKIQEILIDLSVIDEYGQYLEMPKDYIVDSIDEVKAYLRGVFLSKGSANDPKTSRYHLEILLDEKYESVFVQRLLNQFSLNSKILMRDNKYMVYLKDSEKISDFLKLIQASRAVLYYEDIRILREQKNMTNRLNNCEQANIDKIILTCNNQINDINLIDEELGIDFLDDKIKEACIYRLKYPETSLLELSEIISLETGSTITKSGLNHRFRKIREIAQKIEESKKGS